MNFKIRIRSLLLALLVCVPIISVGHTAGEVSNQFVYVTNQADGTISAFSLNATTGVLTPLANSPFEAAGVGPAELVADPTGTHLYVADTQFVPGVRGSNCNAASGQVEVQTVNQGTGQLTLAQQVTLPGVCPTSLVTDTAGKNLYVLLQDTSQQHALIAQYDIHPVTGQMTELATLIIGVVTAPTQIVVAPGGKFVYASTEDGIYLMERNTSTGVLGTASLAWSQPTGALAISNRALFGAVVGYHFTPFILEFSIDANTGALSFLWSVNPDDLPVALALTTTGNYLATANPDDDTTSLYSVPANGQFAPVADSPFPTGSRPSSASFDTLNRFLFVVNFVSSNVTGYALNSATGALTPIAGSPFAVGSSPADIVVVR
ncbi:MAG TPA: beta-propeller fold lactonase family protein [Terriglobales bacterium]|nr:beta-propeller fold lactonase family protein [Terriglobales bacterium]